MSMPDSPTPTPPGEISPSIMCSIGQNPPSGVNESCMQFTAPVEVPVVAAANRPQPAAPKRTSLPSMLPPDCVVDSDWSTPIADEPRVAVLLGEHRANRLNTTRMPPSPPSSTAPCVDPDEHART